MLHFFRNPGSLFAIFVASAFIAITFLQGCNSNSVRNNPAEKARLEELLGALDTASWKNPSSGLRLANEAVSLSFTIGDSTLLAKACLKKAGCYQALDVNDSALIFYKQGLKVSENIGNDSLVAKIKNGIANFYLRREDYPEAMKYLTDALKISERIRYRHVTGLVYNGLGLVSVSMKEYDKAIEYFKNAREICREIGDYPNEAGISLNIASCYADLNEFEKAKEYYLDNLNTLEKINDTAQIVLAYINLAIVDRSLGDFGESFSYLDRAQSLLKVYENQSLLSTTMLETGTTYLETGNLAKAKEYLSKSLRLSSGTLSKSNSMEALSRLSQVEDKLGNPALALKYYKQYAVVKDSIMNDQTRRSVEEIQWKYDLQKKEYDNELLSKKLEIRKRQNISLGILFGSFAIVAILIGILIWLSLKNLRKSYRIKESENARLQEKIISDERINQLEKLYLQSEIDAKNRELTSTSLQLVTKNKILTDIGQMTDEFYRSSLMDKNSHNKLQRLIQENLNIDKEWDQFREMFEKVHPDFFASLKAGYPDLTEHELRLCAYIRISLQNKEIARILNVSPATINTSRYRIRKKLVMDNKSSLEDFLRKI
jgi:tetratricopeptide (TPR) repeat protein